MKLALALLALILASCASSVGRAVPQGYSPVPAPPQAAPQTIESFTVGGARGTVNRFDRTVKLYLPEGASLSSLSPTVAMAAGYTIAPQGTQDFSGGPVSYTVTKTSDGSTDVYQAQAFNTALTASQVRALLGRGINLGNDLDAWTAAGPVGSEEGAWTGGVKAQEYFFDDYLSLGFDSVRVPVTWNRRAGASSPYTVDASFLNRVDTVVGWGIDRGLAVVLNAHHEDWIRTKTGAAFTTALTRFKAIWTQIAAHFKDWPPQLVFEILNEPNGAITQAEVNRLNTEVLAIIRASGGNNATRVVIVGAREWNSAGGLQDGVFAIPSDGASPRLIANFHDYSPWTFAGQAQGSWGTAGDVAALAAELEGARSWAAAHGIPLYMGEFGVIRRYQGKKTDAASRLQWYTTMVELAANKGIAMAAWDDFGDFKLYDRVERTFETAVGQALLED